MQNKNIENTATRTETAINDNASEEQFNANRYRVEINQSGDECVVTLLLNSPNDDLMREAVQSISGLEDAFRCQFDHGMLRLSYRLFMPSGFDESAISYTVSTLKAAADLIQITCGFLLMEG